jgi:hypothetical protein
MLVFLPLPWLTAALRLSPFAFWASVLLVLACLGLSAWLNVLAVRHATRQGVKLWLDPSSWRLRQRTAWPPSCSEANLAGGYLPIPAFLFLFPATYCIALSFLLVAEGQEFGFAVLPGSLGGLFGTVALLGWWMTCVHPPVTAKTPTECWGSQANPPPSQQQEGGGA